MTSEVPGTAPANTSLPEVSGAAKVEQTVTCSTGKWAGVPESFTYTYQWLLEGKAISKATAATFKIPGEDKGKLLSCEVTAKNTAGTGTAVSGAVQITREESSPVNVVKPSVEGTASVGSKLTCKKGEWTGSPEPTFEYEWVRTVGGSETSIVRGTTATYTVVAADRGASLSCVVYAKNEVGSAHQASSNAVAIPGEAPKDKKVPTVTPSGEVKVGETLTCAAGEWTGAPAPTFTYAWVLNGTVEVATGSGYVVTEGDEGGSLVCRVTALNSAGSKEAESEAVRVAEGVPENTTAPKVTPETAVPGETLTCEHGVWTRSPSKYTYQWLLEGASISGATESTYVVIAADEKHSLSCRWSRSTRAGPRR